MLLSLIVGPAFRTTVDPDPVVKGIEILGAVPPEDASGAEAVTPVTVPPVAAAQAGTPATMVRT